MGFIDEKGNLVIPQEYRSNPRSRFNGFGRCIVESAGDKKLTVIDQHNQTLLTIPKDYEAPTMTAPHRDGLFPVCHRLDKNDRSAFVFDLREYNYVGRTRYYAMDMNGNIAFEGNISGGNGHYQLKQPASDRQGDVFGIINRLGEITVPAVFDCMFWSGTDPYVSVLKDGLLGVIDYSGREVIPISYPGGLRDLRYVMNGITVYYDRPRDTCFTINMERDIIARFPATYDISPKHPKRPPWLSQHGMLIKGIDVMGKMYSYYIDVYGKYPMRGFWNKPKTFGYEYGLGFFYDGLATCRYRGRTGYINKSGDFAIGPKFESALPFTSGLAKVFRTKEDRFANRYCYIDTTGDVVACNH